eukprot:1160788-Pelagomonas_calceolata.AAC.1
MTKIETCITSFWLKAIESRDLLEKRWVWKGASSQLKPPDIEQSAECSKIGKHGASAALLIACK